MLKEPLILCPCFVGNFVVHVLYMANYFAIIFFNALCKSKHSKHRLKLDAGSNLVCCSNEMKLWIA